MGFRSDMILGYQELDEDEIYFQHIIDEELVFFLAYSVGVKIKISKRLEHCCLTLFDKTMTFNEFKDKLEEYYDTRDLMILKDNMEDFITRIRREDE